MPGSVASRGSTGWVAAEVQLGVLTQRGQQPRPGRELRQPIGRPGIFGSGALDLCGRVEFAAGAKLGCVAGVGLGSDLAQERLGSARSRAGDSSWSHSTGVSESVSGARPSTRSSGR